MSHLRLRREIGALFLALLCSCQATFAATIVIVNLDGPGEGLNDPTPATPVGGNPGTTLGQQRLNVYNRAAEFWGARLVSSVPIRVAAKFDPLQCTPNSGVLGSAGPIQVFRDFAGAPLPGTWYPGALANALAGTDLDPTEDDISATFNSDVGTAGCLLVYGWYYGFDHNGPANSIHFLDTVLHEFGHGLGFLTFINLNTGTKFNGFDDPYMRHLEDHRTGELYPAMTDAERASANTATGNLHWVGPNVLSLIDILSAGVSGGHVRLYAPNPTQSGSSVSHWDTALSPDELMEPYDTPTVDYRLTVELMKDIGWTVTPPAPVIVTNAAALLVENCGFGNGALDPGETATISLTLRNAGTANTTNLVATLLTGSGVSVAGPPQNYGILIASGLGVNKSFSLSATGLCGTTLTARLQLQDGTNNLGIVSFPFPIGSTASITNSGAISVPASGSGSPYPSTLNVSNQVTNLQGLVVRLFGITHGNPDDLDILLVGPSGQSVILMSDAGGSADLNNVTLTFDDKAAAFLPDSSAINSGVFKPTEYQGGDSFPSPAPAGPYGTNLAVFTGTNPNGAWRLFVRDDLNPRNGSIAGWSLSFPACCANEFGPVLTLSTGIVTYVENSLPLIVDASAVVANAAPDFNNGSLLVQITNNASAEDRLLIRDEGTSPGQIGLVGNSVMFGGVVFGAFTTNPGPSLTVSFATNGVTTSMVQALVRAVLFAVDSENPNTLTRTVRFTLGNGRAVSPAVASRNVRVTAVNDAPVLAPIADQDVNAGQLLLVTASASDVDTPDELLSFSLAAGSPPGASINPTNGVFTWTPLLTQAPGTNFISIIVNDQGVPSFSATQTFKVVVHPGNHPPVLADISDRAVHQGATITFTNSATDLDQPANTLLFSFSSSLPGAALDANTGVFSWTPLPTQAPSTNIVGIVVTDTGIPPLSDAKSFSIIVQPPPQIQTISLSGTNVNIQWTAIAGQSYLLQYKTNIDDSVWMDLTGSVTATNSIATREDAIEPDLQRFYRVFVLP